MLTKPLSRSLRIAVFAAFISLGDADQPAGLEGFVSADLSAAVSGAKIGVDSVSKGFHRETETDVTGYYSINELSPGAYSIWAEVKGLGCIIYPHVSLEPGKRVRQDFRFVRTTKYPRPCYSAKP
jgi:hypothetical protein